MQPNSLSALGDNKMPNSLPTKERVLSAIRSAEAALGHPPSRRELKVHSGVTEYQVLRHFENLRDAVLAAGFEPDTTNVRLDDEALLEAWGEFVRLKGQMPTRRQYKREGKYSPGVFEGHFGPWSSLPGRFREFAQGKPEWADVLALLPSRDADIHPTDDVLLEAWGEVVRELKRSPTVHQYRRLKGRFNPSTFHRRFGGWASVPARFLEFAQSKPEWSDVAALMPRAAARLREVSHPRAATGGISVSTGFDPAIITEAEKAAVHYSVFYCLESTARRLVTDTLQAAFGPNWWSYVPDDVRCEVTKRMQAEEDSGVTPRSKREIDFTTFGELGKIIEAHRTHFAAGFTSLKALKRVMATLNALRNPIAHCCPLPDDEVARLSLEVKAWFRVRRQC